jgi:uncharacterized protein (TIGR02444 family)
MAAEFTSFPAPWREGVMHNDLWRFACDVYTRPGVEAACMAAQANGQDVCLVLCGLWLEQRKVAWSPERAHTLENIALPWTHEVIQPLRALRQQWRSAAQTDDELAPIREGIKRLELNAERTLLARLQATAQTWPEGETDQLQWLSSTVPSPAIQVAMRAALGLT